MPCNHNHTDILLIGETWNSLGFLLLPSELHDWLVKLVPNHFATSVYLCYLPCKLASEVKFKWSTSESNPGRVQECTFEHLWLPPGRVAWVGENLFVKFILLELHPLHIINLYQFVNEILDNEFLNMLSLSVLTEKEVRRERWTINIWY